MSVIKPPFHLPDYSWYELTQAETNRVADVLSTAIIKLARDCHDVYSAISLVNTLQYKRIQHRHHNQRLTHLYASWHHYIKCQFANKFTGEDLEYYEKETG